MTTKRDISQAVALVYDENDSPTPKIVAGGKGAIAEKIIETARKAGIHIREDANLVELLSKVPIGDTIPVELYQTVAEILAFVYKLDNEFKKKIDKSSDKK